MENQKYETYLESKGKIGLPVFGVIYVIILKTLQYLLSQISKTRWPVICDVVVYRYAFYCTFFSVVTTVPLATTFNILQL